MSRLKKVFSRKTVKSATLKDSPTERPRTSGDSRGSSYFNFDSELDSEMEKVVPTIQEPINSVEDLHSQENKRNGSVNGQKVNNIVNSVKGSKEGGECHQPQCSEGGQQLNAQFSVDLSERSSSSLEEEGSNSDSESPPVNGFSTNRRRRWVCSSN